VDRHRRVSAALVLAACGACNAAFDITSTRPPDGDNDGTSDSADNCVLVANEDQRDDDADGLGDVCDPCEGPQSGLDSDGDGDDDLCDPCPTGANSDEDGDGVLDGCDACPADADDQADDDEDGVGNACDAAPGVQNRRLMFDGFDGYAPARRQWRSWFKAWRDEGGAYAPVSGGDPTGAWNLDAVAGGTNWWFEVAAVTPPLTNNDDYFGLLVRAMPGGTQTAECLIDSSFGSWHPNYQTTVNVTVGAIVRFRFHATVSGTECRVDGVPVSTLPVEAARRYVLTLATGNGTRFLWVDAVSGPDAP
jgi:hypothetical protein